MTHRASALISAQEWFSAGERVGYDAERPGINPRSPLRAFIRRAAGTGVTRTFLPGWPDGSYGWAKVEAFLSSRFHFPASTWTTSATATPTNPGITRTRPSSARISSKPSGTPRG